MEGFSPRKLWIREQRALVDAAENCPDIPVPTIYTSNISFHLFANPTPALLASVENALATALGVTFTGNVEEERNYRLTATLPSGRTVRICTPVEAVAHRRVTGQKLTDVVEWVRLPAGSASTGEPAGATASTA